MSLEGMFKPLLDTVSGGVRASALTELADKHLPSILYFLDRWLRLVFYFFLTFILLFYVKETIAITYGRNCST